ncbi:MAG: Myo-inositol 2-dehydrogenase [Candidatus Moanabacter tarae]|uniref:Myo-inositol 2-dehydrogenase n=1 Tax=Candidatus Moanibacter tarae TaxID=2200854 RepID=A0A2Z4AQ75_9BACT|nr:MAG: Myo-inositol 2-dehydrogenase [Candidatus Moanabacter tarae]
MNIERKYRVALIGTGRVGYQFSFGGLPDNHAEAVQNSEACKLVAGVNRGEEKLRAFGKRFGINALYYDYRQMLKEVKPDICIIATHPELHCEMVEGCAAEPSTKAIICEKPMALSLEECDRMIAACESCGVILQINHNRRWNPEWNLGLKLLREGAIGDLNMIFCYMDGGKPAPSWRSENEGPLLHDFTHYFDLMDLFAGDVDWLCGMAEQRRQPWPVEDFSAAFMKFKKGVTGVIYGAELTSYSNHGFELRGTEGVIRFDSERVRLYQSQQDMYEPESGFQWSSLQEKEVLHPEAASTYVLGLGELLDALNGRGLLRSDGLVGRRSLEMVMAIYQSQLQGNCPVKFPVSVGGSGVAALRRAGDFKKEL